MAKVPGRWETIRFPPAGSLSHRLTAATAPSRREPRGYAQRNGYAPQKIFVILSEPAGESKNLRTDFTSAVDQVQSALASLLEGGGSPNGADGGSMAKVPGRWETIRFPPAGSLSHRLTAATAPSRREPRGAAGMTGAEGAEGEPSQSALGLTAPPEGEPRGAGRGGKHNNNGRPVGRPFWLIFRSCGGKAPYTVPPGHSN